MRVLCELQKGISSRKLRAAFSFFHSSFHPAQVTVLSLSLSYKCMLINRIQKLIDYEFIPIVLYFRIVCARLNALLAKNIF